MLKLTCDSKYDCVETAVIEAAQRGELTGKTSLTMRQLFQLVMSRGEPLYDNNVCTVCNTGMLTAVCDCAVSRFAAERAEWLELQNKTGCLARQIKVYMEKPLVLNLVWPSLDSMYTVTDSKWQGAWQHVEHKYHLSDKIVDTYKSRVQVYMLTVDDLLEMAGNDRDKLHGWIWRENETGAVARRLHEAMLPDFLSFYMEVPSESDRSDYRFMEEKFDLSKCLHKWQMNSLYEDEPLSCADDLWRMYLLTNVVDYEPRHCAKCGCCDEQRCLCVRKIFMNHIAGWILVQRHYTP